MKLIDIVNGAWAIEPAMLNEIRGIYATHLRGEKINLAAIEASLGRSLKNGSHGYEVVDGVAIIPVIGVTAKKMNMFADISGGASTELIGKDVRAAVNDPAVNSIILHIDSPGGTVDGTQALANIIAEARTKKPMATLGDGVLCSASYWYGCATGEVFIADDTTRVGSIGVVTGHRDISGWEEKQGLKTTEITAGKYKRVTSAYAPLSADGRDSLQADVDYIYSLFVDSVAAAPGVDVDTVLQHMADGRIFTGKAAITAGLVDGVSTLPQMIERMKSKSIAAGGAAPITASDEEPIMNIQELQEKHPELYQAAVAQGMEAGAVAERARIAAIQATALPGHEALVKKCIEEGVSAGDAASQILAAENANLAAIADAFASGGAPPVDAAESGNVEQEATARASVVSAAVDAANGKR